MIQQQTQGPVGWLRLQRPEAMNSLTPAMLYQLQEHFDLWREDRAVRVVVLTGCGRAFCVGADLKAALEREDAAAGQAEMLGVAARLCATIRSYPKPVIAAVNGVAMAGGMELVIACDLVLAASSARLGDAHANFGVFPGAGAAALLTRRVPTNVAKWLLFSGELMSAAELHGAGLVNEVVPDADLERTVQARAEQVAEKSSMLLARMKRVANAALDKATDDALREELAELHEHLRSPDFREGLRAFAEKRKPRFNTA